MTTLTRRSFLSTSAAAAACILRLPKAWAEKGPADAGFTFVQICDPQLGMGGYEHDVETFRLAVRHVNGLRPRPALVAVCGDLINTPGSEEQIKDFNAIKAGFEVPCHCVPGNHDLGNETQAAFLKQYRQKIGDDYYLKDLPHCALIALNTQLWKSPIDGESDKQVAWLEKAVQKASSLHKPIIIFGHHPLFLRKPEEDEAYYTLAPERRHHLLRLFKMHGVAAYLAGHTHRNGIHDYEGIQLVTSATTSRNFDGAPMGFRLWQVRPPQPYNHQYIAINEAKPPEMKK